MRQMREAVGNFPLTDKGINKATPPCKWANISRRSWYYCSHKSKPKVNEHLASQIKDHIERHPSDGYRSVAWYLQLNKNTVQRIFQLKNWQVRKRSW